MSKTRDMACEAVLRTVKEKDVKFLRFWFTDIMGTLKSFAIPVEELEDALDHGMGFDGSSIAGYQSIEESDMIAMPDPTTFQLLPWRPSEKAVARMICDVLEPGGKPYMGDPRYILKRSLARAEKLGFDHFYVGPELEYFYFKDSKGTEVLDRGGYFDLTPLDEATELRRETIFFLEQMGIPVEFSHHEVGSSQHEIDIRYGDALERADFVMTYRLVVKEIAVKNGVYATFMPKPIHGENGSGMHTHQSLFKKDKNAFYDGSDSEKLSKTARGFIAGQLKHAREISAIFAQWPNSYKRLVPGYEAPIYVAWSHRNRSALIRVPYHTPGKESQVRSEFRSPDPACNPYLTFAVMLEAGLDGIEKGYDLPDPIDKNLYNLSDKERADLGINALPENLGEALAEMEKSSLVKKVLGKHIFGRFLKLKTAEWREYQSQITEFEIDRYLPIL